MERGGYLFNFFGKENRPIFHFFKKKHLLKVQFSVIVYNV